MNTTRNLPELQSDVVPLLDGDSTMPLPDGEEEYAPAAIPADEYCDKYDEYYEDDEYGV